MGAKGRTPATPAREDAAARLRQALRKYFAGRADGYEIVAALDAQDGAPPAGTVGQ